MMERDLPTVDTSEIRVWAEEEEPGFIHVTWAFPDDDDPRDEASDRRAVAATLHVHPHVKNARPEGSGVTVRYDAEQLQKSDIAAMVRAALANSVPFKERASDVLKRVPTYLNLAQKLALDSRVSPLPEAAQNFARRPATGLPPGLPLHVIPGFRLASRIQTALPVLQSLATWSRDAPPEVVAAHLLDAGLSREQLDLDHATAQEMKFYVRDFSGEKAEQAKVIASDLASQASVAGRQWWQKARVLRDEFIESRAGAQAASDDAGNETTVTVVENEPEDRLVEAVDEGSEP